MDTLLNNIMTAIVGAFIIFAIVYLFLKLTDTI